MSDHNHRLTALNIPATTRKTILRAIYSHWDTLTAAESFACRRDCADCCTQSVTATSLEAAMIQDHYENSGTLSELTTLLARTDRTRNNTPNALLLTTNEYVARYLSGNPPVEENAALTDWNLTPCPFLLEKACSIYPVRPFGCRAFASTEACGIAGHAVVPPYYPTKMTVVMQLIEHLDAGMSWGNLLDLLAGQGENISHTFAVSRRLPGFLLEENERPTIKPMLATLASISVAGKTIGEWINAL